VLWLNTQLAAQRISQTCARPTTAKQCGFSYLSGKYGYP